MRKLKYLLLTAGIATVLAVGVGAGVATQNYSNAIQANAAALKPTDAGVATYNLVTKVDQLETGDNIIIAGYKSSDTSWHALSTTRNTKNVGQIGVTNNKNVITTVTGVNQITLEGSAANGWNLNGGDGYLYASGEGKNNLMNVKSTIDDSSTFDISFDSESKSTIKARSNNRNQLAYNPNNNIFSCYSNMQGPTYIFKLENATTGISISYPNTNLIIGEEGKLNTVLSKCDQSTPVTYTSSNPNSITVDAEGNIKAIAVGETDITAKMTVDGQEYTSKVLHLTVKTYNLVSKYTAYQKGVEGSTEEYTVILKVNNTLNKTYGNIDYTLADGSIFKIYGSKTTSGKTYKEASTDEKYHVDDVIKITGTVIQFSDYYEIKDGVFEKTLTPFEQLIYDVENSEVCGLTSEIVSGYKARYDALSPELKTIFNEYTVSNLTKDGTKVYPTLIERLESMEKFASNASGSLASGIVDNDAMIISIVAISVISISAIAMFAIVKRKKLVK